MPKKESTATLKLRGSYRPDRHATRDQVPATKGPPAKPTDDELGEFGSVLWDEVVAARKAILDPVDRFSLTLLCCMYEASQQAYARYEMDPSKDNRITWHACADRCFQMLEKFYCTPKSRQTMPAVPDNASEENATSKYIKHSPCTADFLR